MKTTRILFLGISTLLSMNVVLHAQLLPNAYLSETKENGKTLSHELKVDGDYLVLSVYQSNPPKFIKTLGGHYEVKDSLLVVNLEFNSAHAKDSITKLLLPFALKKNGLLINYGTVRHFTPVATKTQALDGQWLFATRGPDTGQERRGEQQTRKTLKFLCNGRFQWIAYDTKGFQFKGTGGGRYTAEHGRYTEYIEYFSRDSSRVGASLGFDFDIQDQDWHHRGKNSKGVPLYEIWARRPGTK